MGRNAAERVLAWSSSLALAMALSLWPALGVHAADPWRVVLLPGTDPAQPAAALQDRAFRRTLTALALNGVEFYSEPLDSLRFEGGELMPYFLALLAKKYERRKVDIVVGLSDFALEFTEQHRDKLWPGKPVLIYSIEQHRLRERGLPADFAHLDWNIDIDGTLGIAEALQPAARRLVVVSGSTPFDLYWARRAADAARRRSSRQWVAEIWSGMPLEELRQRLSALDRSTAVIYTTMLRDRTGRAHFPFEVVKPMSQSSGAPIYSWYPTYLEQGLAAGSMLDFEENGRRAAQLAASILRGEVAAAGASLPPTPTRCQVNVERLEALGLDVDALPRGCELLHQPPSLWRDYRGQVIGGVALVGLQAFTISALLAQHRRRRRAEEEAAKRRVELNRAMRVATVGELSASIAHEVGQPLGAIVANTEAARLMLSRGAGNQSELDEIFSDVRRDALRAHEVVRRLRGLLQKQSIQFAPLDLGATLEDALALLEPEARRRGIRIERRLAGGATLLGDPIQLQQVLLNLALNAMDAMGDTAPDRSVLSISLRAAGQGHEIEVADRGHGFGEDERTKLFESFFTTKPHGMGLGLSIVRTVINAHRGSVRADTREGGGSVFTVWLPRPGTDTETPGEPARDEPDAAAGVGAWQPVPGERP